MAEFLERWWRDQETTPPTFVTDFIQRHRGSAPPPAAPVFGTAVADEDMRAARLALLVMRGALFGSTRSMLSSS
jgi:hypothetical protein